MFLEMEVNTPRRHQLRTRLRCVERECQTRHRDSMWIVGMNNVGIELTDDTRQLPRGRKIDFTARRERDQIGSFERAPIKFAIAVRDEHGAVAHGAQSENGQEDLVLSAAPGPSRVEMEREHCGRTPHYVRVGPRFARPSTSLGAP